MTQSQSVSQIKETHFSVAIVGSGPAGASCAISLLRRGASRVALIDKARFPRDKSCGDGIGPGAVRVAEKLGLGDSLKIHRPIKYLSIAGPSGVRAKGPLPAIGNAPPTGYTIPRITFDNYIFQGALAAGAIDLSGRLVENAVYDGDIWTLTLKSIEAGNRNTVTADIVIGADGARSKIRRCLNVPMNSDRHTGTAARIYAESEQANFDALQIDFTGGVAPAYGWLFPIDKRHANVGVIIDLDNFRRQHERLDALLNSYRRTLGKGMRYDEDSYSVFLLPYGSDLPQLAHPRMKGALVGDAGSMVNPLTGEGIFYGMFAGELLGRLLAHALSTGDRTNIDLALADYEKQFRRRFKQHYDVNWTMKENVENPKWCNMVINACRKDQVVLSDLIDLMMGDKRNIGIGKLFRIVARNVLPFLP